MRRQYSERDRSKFLAEMRRRGEAVWSVARRMGLSKGTAYRWWSAAQENESPQVFEFAQLVRSSAIGASALVVEVGSARIQVEAGFDAQLLRSVVAALSAGADS